MYWPVSVCAFMLHRFDEPEVAVEDSPAVEDSQEIKEEEKSQQQSIQSYWLSIQHQSHSRKHQLFVELPHMKIINTYDSKLLKEDD